MTKDLIIKSFKVTGLYPVDRTVFTQEDFAPSKASSSTAHVPNDFPEEFPSSDPIEIDSDYKPASNDSNSDSETENGYKSASGDRTGICVCTDIAISAYYFCILKKLCTLY